MIGGLPDEVLLCIGLILLVFGGEAVVQGSMKIASHFGMPSFLVGFTLVAIGTSLPELGVVLNALSRGTEESVDLAVGGVLGSNIANVMLVLSIAIILGATSKPDKNLREDALMLLVATGVGLGATLLGEFPAWLGVMSIFSMGVYFAYILKTRGEDSSEDGESWIPGGMGIASIAFIGGLVLVKYGSDFLIEGGEGVAISMGVPETVIGLTLVAFGTSLPELAVTITASLRGVQGVAIGNILGSNVANVMAVLSIGSIVGGGIGIADSFLDLDIWVLVASSGLAACSILIGKGLSRPLGGLMLVGYGAYIIRLFMGS
jgi:cation:H+ antiporter